MGVSLPYCIEAAETIVGTPYKTSHVSRRNAAHPQHDGHRRRVEFAVPAPGFKQKMVERIGRAARRGAQVVLVIGAERLLELASNFKRVVPASCELMGQFV